MIGSAFALPELSGQSEAMDRKEEPGLMRSSRVRFMFIGMQIPRKTFDKWAPAQRDSAINFGAVRAAQISLPRHLDRQLEVIPLVTAR